MYAIPLSLAQQLRSEGAFSVFEGASPLTSLLLLVELRGFEFYNHNSPKMATSLVLQRSKRIDARIIRTQIRHKEHRMLPMCPLRGRFSYRVLPNRQNVGCLTIHQPEGLRCSRFVTSFLSLMLWVSGFRIFLRQ